MGYSRIISPGENLSGKALDRALVGIGIRLTARPSRHPNIEDTLDSAVSESMRLSDYRLLSLVASWIDRHHARINADRMLRLAKQHDDIRVRAFWAATRYWMDSDRRFRRFEHLHDGDRVDILSSGTDFQISRRGEDPRFEASALRVPAGVLRDRPGDVLSPEELARRHPTYRMRIVIGPTYRADMWAALDENPELTPTELARQTYGSFATAWQVVRDRALLAA